MEKLKIQLCRKEFSKKDVKKNNLDFSYIWMFCCLRGLTPREII